MNFIGSNFFEADLSNSQLNKSILSGSNFIGANLRKSNLAECTLYGTNFTGANLEDAVLTDSYMPMAILSMTNVQGTDFNNSFFLETILSDLDLQATMGLTGINHLGASHISTSTIYRSRGQIPRAFLKGCGLDDIFIDYIPDLIAAAKPIQFHSCFISYSSKDKVFAQKLHQDLTDAKVKCWLDSEDLKIGDRLRPAITKAIRHHDKLLLIISPESATSDWVEDEVEEALAQEKRNDDGTRIDKLFPIRIASFDDLPDEPWLNALKRKRHIGDFSACNDEASYQKALDRLLRDLNASAELEEKGRNLVTFSNVTNR